MPGALMPTVALSACWRFKVELVVLIIVGLLILKGTFVMANNFSRLNDAVTSVANEVAAVAAAIRNPASDNNDQAVIDDLSTRLESAAEALRSATQEENDEDAGTTNPLPM
jgi:hypothetical protein